MNRDRTKLPGEAERTDAGSSQPAQPSLIGMTRDLALAGIGIGGVLRDGAHSLYARSVERGRENVRRVAEKLKLIPVSERSSGGQAARRALHSQLAYEDWKAALASSRASWLNIPSAADVDRLNKQIADLEAKIGQLTSDETPAE